MIKIKKSTGIVFILSLIGFYMIACNNNENIISSEKQITAFSINSIVGIINENEKSISVTLPNGTNLTNLIPSVNVSAKADYIPKGAQDFNSSKIYTVIAEDGSKQDYNISVVIEQPEFIYSIGDIGPGGGKIFYIADGQNGRPLGFSVKGYGSPGDPNYFATYTAYYLEIAPENALASNVQWGGKGEVIEEVTTFTINTNSKASEIGNGRKDTYLIVSHLGSSESNRAAQVCVDYRGPNNLNDWFLPSSGEIYLYYQNISIGTYLWSSSQYSSAGAWLISFEGNNLIYQGKDFMYPARAIRAF